MSPYKILWESMDKKGRNRFFALIILMIISAISEIFGIALILPFITLIMDASILEKYPAIKYYFDKILLLYGISYINLISMIFIGIIVMALLIKTLYLKLSTDFAFHVAGDLGFKIYRNILYKNLIFYKENNVAKLTDTIINKINDVVFKTIIPAINLISNLLLLIIAVCVMLFVDRDLTLMALTFLIVIYYGVVKGVRKRLDDSASVISSAGENLSWLIQQALSGIREIKLNNLESKILEKFNTNNNLFRFYQAKSTFIGLSPRYFIESFGMLVLVILTILLLKNNSISATISMLGFIALSLQKILPVSQNIYWSWSELKVNYQTLSAICKYLNINSASEKKCSKPINFNRSITLKNIHFRYSGMKKDILDSASVSIHKNDKVGIIGETGSGKSTLIDLIAGLIVPTSGCIYIDEDMLVDDFRKSWFSKVSYVTQAPFILDGSILQNIAFGIETTLINMDRVIYASKIACIHDLIEKFPNGYFEDIGVGGAKLSGGQKQRLAIARAIYKQSEVLILDEPTSALDAKTELNVLGQIENLNITLIVISHNSKSLNFCNKIYRVSNNKIERVK